MILSDQILGRNPGSWWRFVVACVLAFGIYVVMIVSLGVIITMILELLYGEADLMEAVGADSQLSISGIFFYFSIVSLMHVPLAMVIYLIYRRPYLSLVNPLKRPARADWIYGAVFILGAGLIAEIFVRFWPIWQSETWYIWDIKLWLIWVLPVAFIVFLQCAAEEMVFRGFMQQYLARLTRRRWIYYSVPALIWSALHYANYEGIWLVSGFVITTFIMGLILADWADIRGSLIGPISAHFVNNFIAVCVVGNSEESSVMNIFVTDISMNSDAVKFTYMMIFMLAMVIMYYFLRKRLNPIVPDA